MQTSEPTVRRVSPAYDRKMDLEAVALQAPNGAVGNASLRLANSALIARLVRSEGPLTRADIVRLTGLTRPTVVAIIRSLLADQTLLAAGTDEPVQQRGRPGLLLAFNPAAVVVAVGRLMGTFVDVRLADASGHQLAEASRPAPADPALLPYVLADLVRELAATSAVGRLRSMTVLASGRIDPLTGECAARSAFDEVSVPVREVLERELDVPVKVLNPAVAAALAPRKGQDDHDVVVVFLDRGIGAGILAHRQMLLGATGAAGELGHCRLPGNALRCRCGLVGCLETVAAGWAITERIRAALGPAADVPATLAEMEALSDPRIDEILSEAAAALGLAVSWLVNILDPASLLLGGSTFTAGATRFLDTFANQVHLLAAPNRRTALVVDFAAPDSVLDGAFHAALDLIPLTARTPSSTGPRRDPPSTAPTIVGALAGAAG
jgi:predicted NBD/HSP70 family sugar kinase